MKDLPIYKCSVSDDDDDKIEVGYIALVDVPAIKKNFLAYETKLCYAITNEEEQIVTGLAMIADLPIYRREKEGEFYTVFDAVAIKKIAQRFFRKKYNFNFNLSHNPNAKVDDVYVFESWFVDREKGKSPLKEFSDVSNGSWIISAKVDNAEVWKDIKEGKFNGFSVEGFFTMERIKPEEDITEEQFIYELKKLLQAATL